jgi:hypothetical protein
MTRLPMQFSQAPSAPPTHALPTLFRRISHEFAPSLIDPSIIFSVLLAFISLLSQGLFDVLWPNGQRRRIGVSVLLVSPSVTGKSVLFRALMAAIRGALSKFNAGGADSSRGFPLFVEDLTREALIRHLHEWPIAALFTDEAEQVQSLLRNGASTMAKCLDGDPIYHARVGEGRLHVEGQLLLMFLMAQPNVYESMKSSLSSGKGGVGIGNRMYWAYGQALPTGARPDHVHLSGDVDQQYSELVESLMTRTIALAQKKKERPALRLSPDASRYVLGLNEELRQIRGHSQHWMHAGEYLARHVERTLSLAAAFHAVEQDDADEIPLAQIKAADEIGRWSVDNFAFMTFEPPSFTATEQDAMKLEGALHQVVMATRSTTLTLADLRRCAPNIGLTRGRFDRALACLGAQGKLLIVPNGRVDLLQILVPVQPLVPSLYR